MEVAVSFGDQEKVARADANGRWQVTLDPMAASAEPRDLCVRANDSVTIRDVLVGEVWLASGQSNMGRRGRDRGRRWLRMPSAA